MRRISIVYIQNRLLLPFFNMFMYVYFPVNMFSFSFICHTKKAIRVIVMSFLRLSSASSNLLTTEGKKRRTS